MEVPIGTEEPHHSLGLLERLDKAVEQNPVKTPIAEADAILVMFVERIHGRLPDPKAGRIVDRHLTLCAPRGVGYQGQSPWLVSGAARWPSRCRGREFGLWSRLTSAWLPASEVVQAVHRGYSEKNLGRIDSSSLVRQGWTSGEGRGVMAHAPVPPRIRRVQVSALLLLVIAGTLNYVDRAALSIANPLIREELGLSISDMAASA